jgi:hypothetical protein
MLVFKRRWCFSATQSMGPGVAANLFHNLQVTEYAEIHASWGGRHRLRRSLGARLASGERYSFSTLEHGNVDTIS